MAIGPEALFHFSEVPPGVVDKLALDLVSGKRTGIDLKQLRLN
jgi:hypothetical protein